MSRKSYLVRQGDGRTVGEIMMRAAPGDSRAIADGRVFLGRARVQTARTPVRVGDEVTIAAVVVASEEPVRVLARGDGWIAVDKPSGMPTIPDHGGASHALVTLALRAVRSVGAPVSHLHATSRLDRDVSGVVVFAFGADAAARLKEARDQHRYERRYVALVSFATKEPTEEAGTWDAPIGRAKDPRHRTVNGRDATNARTHFAVIARAGDVAVLALEPVTGRTHQLRVHAAHAGAPILGDRTYGAPPRLTLPSGKVLPFDRVALHAARVRVDGVTIESRVPALLRETWTAFGGDDGAWEEAIVRRLAPPPPLSSE